jgi:hypothetical protein
MTNYSGWRGPASRNKEKLRATWTWQRRMLWKCRGTVPGAEKENVHVIGAATVVNPQKSKKKLLNVVIRRLVITINTVFIISSTDFDFPGRDLVVSTE